MRLISRKEAADMIRADEQTVSNWVAWGVIKGRKVRGRTYVDADTIISVLDTAHDVAHAKESLQAMRDEYKKECEALEKDVREIACLRSVFGEKFPKEASANIVLQTISVLVERGALTEREADVLASVVYGDNLHAIAVRYGLTFERIRQIFYKGIRRVIKNVTDARVSEIPKNEETIKEQRLEIIQLRAENEKLKERLSVYEEREEVDVDVTNELDKDFIALLSTRLAHCDVTVRFLNCCKTLDIENVGDLLSHSKTDYIKCRNFGKKSLYEMEDFVEFLKVKAGRDLYLGMDFPQAIKENVLTEYQYKNK